MTNFLKKLGFALVVDLIWCTSCFAKKNVIGQSRFITVEPITFLTDQGGYEDYFNFFVTLELLVALIALFFRWIGRILRS